jgi:hypothetical protein
MDTKKKSTNPREHQPAADNAAVVAEYCNLAGRLNSALCTIAETAQHSRSIAAFLILPMVAAAEREVEDLRKMLGGLVTLEEFAAARRASWVDFKKRPEPPETVAHEGS